MVSVGLNTRYVMTESGLSRALDNGPLHSVADAPTASTAARRGRSRPASWHVEQLLRRRAWSSDRRRRRNARGGARARRSTAGDRRRRGHDGHGDVLDGAGRRDDQRLDVHAGDAAGTAVPATREPTTSHDADRDADAERALAAGTTYTAHADDRASAPTTRPRWPRPYAWSFSTTAPRRRPSPACRRAGGAAPRSDGRHDGRRRRSRPSIDAGDDDRADVHASSPAGDRPGRRRLRRADPDGHADAERRRSARRPTYTATVSTASRARRKAWWRATLHVVVHHLASARARCSTRDAGDDPGSTSATGAAGPARGPRSSGARSR